MEYVGYGMLFVMFLTMFILCGNDVGYKAASIIFGSTFGIVGWIYLAIYLINP